MPNSAAHTVREILLERGPLDTPALLSEAIRAGARLTENSLDELLHEDDELTLVVCLLDGRHGLLDGILAGRTFTHRLTELEIAHDVLSADPDLLMLAPLLDYGSDALEMSGGAAEWGSDVHLERYEGLVAADFEPDDVVAVPPGTLSGCEPGSVVGLTVSGDGARVSVVQPDRGPADLADRIGTLIGEFSRGRDDDDPTPPMPVPIDELVAELCDRDATLFTEPLTPLGELLGESGFITVDGDVAAEGTDVDAWHTAKDVAGLASIYRIPIENAMTVSTISTLVRTLADAARDAPTDELGLNQPGTVPTFAHHGAADAADAGGVGGVSDHAAGPGDAVDVGGGTRPADATEPGNPPDQVLAPVVDIRSDRRGAALPSLAGLSGAMLGGDLSVGQGSSSIVASTALLQDPETAQALLADALGLDREPAVVLGALARAWEPVAPRGARVALRWVRARCEERLGRADLAEADLEHARGLQSDWPPVLEDLARYAADRGDAERAISLLRRAGAPDDDEELVFLQGLHSPARADLGRNKPCWCGSGRKYKVCHLGKEALPLESRAGWLYRKMTTFAGEGPFRYLLMDLAERRSAFDTSEFALLSALRDPLVLDAVLFEGGAALEFLQERGHLLPDDERALAESWLDVQRSVFEVEEVRVGQGFRVRDLRTGERRDVAERTASRSVRRGHRLLMRVVPVGDSWQIFGGGEPLPMSMEQAALELCDALAEEDAGPEELVDFATARFAPPEMRTIDGEPMVVCTAHYRVDDLPAVTAELDQRFDRDGEDRWSRSDGDSKRPAVLGSLELGPNELTVTAMNERRFRSLQREVANIAGLTLIDTDRMPAAEMMRRAASGGGIPDPAGDGAGPDLEDAPEVQALLADYARDYEQQWLDMSLPALGGATPRQAADDPTRREDLVRLLDSFDDIDAGPGSMQPDRLRAALGL
ncbi:MAG TPA: SEC-C metal-binding domain-containing protein [Nakamurella sp.]|nr:SEC-C metal-binding domain-containing protein [Nakamurella sp.]